MDVKEKYNVVAYGDSITRGVVYDNEKSRYTNIKDCFVNLVSTSINGTVYNAGRFGNTIKRGISKIYGDVIKKSPDIVLIEFGGNDCDFNWKDVAEKPTEDHQPNTDIPTFKDILLNMIDTVKSSGATPILMTLPPLDSERYFKWITRNDKSFQDNILKWLGTEDIIYKWHSMYNETIKEVAEKTKTTLIDVRSEFLKCMDYKKFLCVDGIHPNSEGHTLIANTILSFLREKYDFVLQGTVN
ncbi:SGNH/GDSL hydrolase family protein [Clostridium manihotivorum]|uniref:G-D-S-L family lipolytic protein n=1 Tax=Clostridium manihotivorum TaxID=2320868 RepID=A0A3R5U7E6_9CLOT|nr:SGNH/GDSL hydrolase family protein [Clostridium manihotivorum]QAA33777.1 G-D-S-L family lipolytic protein [Clostridium manihotivorum]